MAALITGFRTTMLSGVPIGRTQQLHRDPLRLHRRAGAVTGQRPAAVVGQARARAPGGGADLGQLPGIDEALFNFGVQRRLRLRGAAREQRAVPGLFLGLAPLQPGRVHRRARLHPRRGAAEPFARGALLGPGRLELFGQRDPIGRRVRVGNLFRGTQEEFTVVGVFQPEANIFASVVKHFAIFPYTAATRRLRQNDWQAQILVVPKDSVSMSEAQDEVIAADARDAGPGAPRGEQLRAHRFRPAPGALRPAHRASSSW